MNDFRVTVVLEVRKNKTFLGKKKKKQAEQ